MYKVYVLAFGDYVYVGCTNNIRRRKDQHNENARLDKSKLGRFLKKNNIVLTVDDFKIHFESDDRKEALRVEKATAIRAENSGYMLLNDNYSKDCSRKGKNIGHTAKTFVVIDYINHTETTVTDLRQFCFENGLDYKLIHRTCGGASVTGNRYCVFHEDDWNKEHDKKKYLDGTFIKERDSANMKKLVKRSSKTYIVEFPDGHSETVFNLDKFAREHHLTSGTLHATLTKNKPTKGYKVLRRI